MGVRCSGPGSSHDPPTSQPVLFWAVLGSKGWDPGPASGDGMCTLFPEAHLLGDGYSRRAGSGPDQHQVGPLGEPRQG